MEGVARGGVFLGGVRMAFAKPFACFARPLGRLVCDGVFAKPNIANFGKCNPCIREGGPNQVLEFAEELGLHSVFHKGEVEVVPVLIPDCY